MKYFCLCILFITAMDLYGCHASSHSDTAPQASPDAERTLPTAEAPQIDDTGSFKNCPFEAQFHDAMDAGESTPEIQAQYALALQVLEQHTQMKFTIKTALRTGKWFILRVNPPEGSADGASMAVNQQNAYLVDMENRRVIAQDDWLSVSYIFHDIARNAPLDSAMQTPAFAQNLARFAAAVAAENAEIFLPAKGNSYPEDVGMPALTAQNGHLILTWFSANSATPPMYIRYRLSLENGLTFQSEIVGEPHFNPDSSDL